MKSLCKDANIIGTAFNTTPVVLTVYFKKVKNVLQLFP
jgi:hypothetical protein